MTKLSININKVAVIRNSRGKNFPSITEVAIRCQEFGAHGITIHPRPDERHITRKDVFDLKPLVTTKFNIEGNPEKPFVDLILEVKPHQVTLVPDSYDQITSNHGWNVKKHFEFLKEIVAEFEHNEIKTSIFLDPDPKLIEFAAKTGTKQIELYTEAYATEFLKNKKKAVQLYKKTAEIANEYALEINAGHDLSLDNIGFLLQEIPSIKEVSIGHALISEALYLGLENTIQLYLKKIYRSFQRD